MKFKLKKVKLLKQCRSIASVLLVFVFLFPSIIKLEHHHEHFECNAKNYKHFHVQHEKCVICCFEFSLFKSSSIIYSQVDRKKEQDNYSNTYVFENYSDGLKYSFSLRAPPIV